MCTTVIILWMVYILISRKKQNSVTLGLWIYFHPGKSIDMNQELKKNLKDFFGCNMEINYVFFLKE